MTNTDNTNRDQDGRFLSGCKAGPGRPKSSRNHITEHFLTVFAADVEQHGADVIERVRTEQPGLYLKIWADLLPAKAELNVNVDVFNHAGSILEAFQLAAGLLGADPDQAVRRLRRHAPHLLEGNNVS